MRLTRSSRRLPKEPNSFPTLQLTLLALVRLAEPVALTSIFPYAWKLVLRFHICDESNAAFYAGILISAFSLAEACTGMFWGCVSDRIGRKPVLLFGCAGTLLSLLVVGFATNFWIALIGRTLGGILNGNIGVVQTMVGELVTNPDHEPRAYAIMPFVWSIGTIVGPSIGGYFAEPYKSMPSLFSSTGFFAKFPFLLPNLICALLLLGSIAAGYLFLDETHPNMQSSTILNDDDKSTIETPLVPTAAAQSHAAADLRSESYGTFNAVNVQQDQSWHVRSDGKAVASSPSSNDHERVFSKSIIILVAALSVFTYHSMSYDHLLPIFLQDKRHGNPSESLMGISAGGLGITIQKVGLIMSVNGLIALFIQALIFPLMAAWLGVWQLFVLVTIGQPVAYFIVPYLAALPPAWLYPGIYSCLAVRNFFQILAYPLFLILIKEACPSSAHLGRINGLAASTGAACRTIASPVAGLLYGVGIQLRSTALPWWSSGLVALLGAFFLPFVTRPNHRRAEVSCSIPSCRLTKSNPAAKDNCVYINVETVESDDDEYVEEEEVVV